MKKIIFYITVALAIFFSNSNKAYVVKPDFGFKINQQDCTLGGYQIGIENIFDDDFFKVISNDDTNDSERKKIFSKTVAHRNYYNTNLIPQENTHNYTKNNLQANLFFKFRTPLFIFIRVLRL